MTEQQKPEPEPKIATDGGTYVHGDVTTGKDFIGRDQNQATVNVPVNVPVNVHVTLPAYPAFDRPRPALADPSQPGIPLGALPAVPCPYRGLEPFEAEHAANYFGRAAMVQKLLDKLAATNFVAVVGPSGSGKSSLVRAGLITALRDNKLPGSRTWDMVILRPGEDPLRALAQPIVERMAATLTPVDRLKETRKLADSLRDETLPIGDVLAQLREQPTHPPRLLLLIDQFEETFTLCADEALRRTFLAALLAAAQTNWLTVLFTLRADFFGRILEDEHFGKRVDAGLVPVLTMNAEERRAAIEQPALNAGRRFEEGLVQRILDAVAAAPGELPLLEFALTELWERQTPDGLLTHAAYEAIGELNGAIAQRADDALKSFNATEQLAVRKVFTRLVRVAQPDEGAEDTKRRVNLNELDATMQLLVRKLADARLLVTGHDDETGEETVEVAHEALIRNWAELKGWLNGDREFLLWRQRLRTMVANWQASGRDAGALLRGALLTEGRGWLQTRTADLSEQERNFITASQAAAEAEAQEREAARQRELTLERQRAEEQTQAAATLRKWALGLVLVSICAVLFALAAGYFGNEANKQKAVAITNAKEADNQKAVAVANAQEADKQKGLALVAQQTAEANADLANQQLARLAGAKLLQDARDLKKAGNFQAALTKFDEADQTTLRPEFDLKAEKEDVLRQHAIFLVGEGEKLARNHDLTGAAAKYQAALDLKPPLDTPVYVRVDAGEFTMGSDATADEYAQEDEKPQHKVTVGEFWLQRTEVSNTQYQACVVAKQQGDAKGCDASETLRANQTKLGTWPVVNVSWDQAQQYAAWKGGRLPSEAEWEKACRGDKDTRIYPWGDQAPTPELANFAFNEGTWTSVGSYPQGASPYGLFDMAGNVWEWTADWYDEEYYSHSPENNPQGAERGDTRSLRGGAFYYGVFFVRCAGRYAIYPDFTYSDVGFRVVSPGF